MKQISQNSPQYGLKAETRLHEAGIASNRESASSRWIRSRALYTLPVKVWELGEPQSSNYLGRRLDQWLDLSRNKASVAEAVDGLPPY